jgi:hypothetical protein
MMPAFYPIINNNNIFKTCSFKTNLIVLMANWNNKDEIIACMYVFWLAA